MSAYKQALNALQSEGKTRRGRLAIGFAAEAGQDGYYRKYGAYRIGRKILPHHLHYGRDWVVKRSDIDGAGDVRAAMVEDELAYVSQNPHHEVLARVFEIAGVDFGRVDYGIVDGKLAIYEINTNPKLPGFNRSDDRNPIRAITKPQLFEGFEALNTPIATKKRYLRFSLPKPRDHRFRWPIATLSRATFQLIFRH